MIQLSIFSLEELPAKASVSQDFEKDLLTQEETLCSPFSLWLKERSQGGLSGKMSPVCCQVTEEGILQPSSLRWGTSGMGSPTGFLTLNILEGQEQCLNGEGECLLSDFLETGDLAPRYYLSPKACQGILRRAEKRGKQLPQMLKEALEAVALG